MAAYRISEAETEGADQDKTKEDGQQSASSQREFRVVPVLGMLKLLVVKNSSHAVTPGLKHFKNYLAFRGDPNRVACGAFWPRA